MERNYCKFCRNQPECTIEEYNKLCHFHYDICKIWNIYVHLLTNEFIQAAIWHTLHVPKHFTKLSLSLLQDPVIEGLSIYMCCSASHVYLLAFFLFVMLLTWATEWNYNLIHPILTWFIVYCLFEKLWECSYTNGLYSQSN